MLGSIERTDKAFIRFENTNKQKYAGSLNRTYLHTKQNLKQAFMKQDTFKVRLATQLQCQLCTIVQIVQPTKPFSQP